MLSDEEVMQLVASKHMPAYKLEMMLGDYQRGVAIRRKMVLEKLPDKQCLDRLPYTNYDYSYVSDLDQLTFL